MFRKAGSVKIEVTMSMRNIAIMGFDNVLLSKIISDFSPEQNNRIKVKNDERCEYRRKLDTG